MVVTVADTPVAERKKAGDLADVIIAGERDVDLTVALAALAERGFARVLAEGGPSLNGQLAAASLLDEPCLTLSPCWSGAAPSGSWPGPTWWPVRDGFSARCASRTGFFPSVTPEVCGLVHSRSR